MKFTVKSEDAVPALALVGTVVDSRSTLHAASLARLQTIASSAGDRLEIAGVNVTGGSLCVTIPCETDAPGSALVNPAELSKRLQKMPEKAKLTAADNRLTIAAKRLRFTIDTIPADEWPTLQAPSGDGLVFSAELLRACIEKVGFAVSSDAERSMSALFLRATDGKLRAIGVDGHRMSILTTEFEGNLEADISQIGITRLSRMLDTYDDDVSVATVGGTTFAVAGNVVANFPHRNYVFPPVDQVIPEKFKHELEVTRDEFKRAVSAASLAGVERDRDGKVVGRRDVGITVTFGKSIRIESHSAEYGEALAELDGEIEGEQSIGLSARYLTEALGACEETIKIGLNGELDPLVLDSGNARHVVMPMRT